MSLLASVTTGKQIGPQIHVIAGINGVGKTTWAASFPSPLIIDLEDGSKHLDVARIGTDKISSLAEFRALLQELKAGQHVYKTLVVDSAEALESLISDAVCAEGRVDLIDKYDGGYGKGYARAREIMREIMQALRSLQMTVVITAHTQVKSHTNPATNQTYDTFVMRCNDKMAGVIKDLADNVFFATYKVFTTEVKGKTRAFGDGQRVMFTQPRPGYDAKNRLELPNELPLSYDAFIEACERRPEANTAELVADIQAMSEKLDEGLKKDVQAMLEKFKNNPTKLKEVKNRLMKYTAA